MSREGTRGVHTVTFPTETSAASAVVGLTTVATPAFCPRDTESRKAARVALRPRPLAMDHIRRLHARTLARGAAAFVPIAERARCAKAVSGRDDFVCLCAAIVALAPLPVAVLLDCRTQQHAESQ